VQGAEAIRNKQLTSVVDGFPTELSTAVLKSGKVEYENPEL
jgi:hypothetical protein